MATIQKRQGARGVRWCCMVWRGAYRATKTFATKREAEAWSAAVENAINRDELVPQAESKNRTIGEFLDRYSRTEIPKKGRQPKLHPPR